MRNKKVVRLTECQLHNFIAESVSKILMEMTPGQWYGKGEEAGEGNEELYNQGRQQLSAEHPANNPLYKNTYNTIGKRT